MLSLRLLTIAGLVKKGSIVLDVGTDHGLLPIYLIKEGICSKVIASDISENALDSAKKNIKKYAVENIKLVVSDGLEKIEDNYNTLTISGMGTKTIIHILSQRENLPKSIILSSNNNLSELRMFMNNLGYKIKKEVAVLDKGKYYDIISYIKGNENLSKLELLYGKSNNIEYYTYLYNKEKKILSNLSFVKRMSKYQKLRQLKKLMKKSRIIN